MVNNYSLGLDSILHSAHYSKNWDKEKQREYNKWYYENKIKRKNQESRTPATPYTINDVEEYRKNHKDELDKIPKHEKTSNWSTVPEADPNAKESNLSKLIDLYGDLKLDGDFIEHHGIKGQKWRVMNGPPYPLSRDISTGSRLKTTSSGKKPGGISGYLQTRKVKKKRQAALEKARQTKAVNAQKKQTAEEHAAEVKKILESGDRNKIKSIASEVSYNDLNTALQKADLMVRLNAQTAPKTAWDKLDNTKNKLDKAIGYYQTGAKTWNVIAQLYNNSQPDASKRMAYLPTDVSPKNPQKQNPQDSKKEKKPEDSNSSNIFDGWTVDTVKKKKEEYPLIRR